MKRTAMALVAATCTLVAGAAGAEPGFGEGGQFVIGLDRAMGLSFESWTVENEVAGYDPSTGNYTYTVESTLSETHLGALGSQQLGMDVLSSGALLPRFALDLFLIDGLSLGTSFMFVSTSGDAEHESDDDSFDADAHTGDLPTVPTVQTMLVAPRVGYSFELGKVVALWPRAGVTYARRKLEDEDGNTSKTTMMDLTLEGMFVISPVSHFALLIGPFTDISLTGKEEREREGGDSVEHDFSLTAFGLSAGVAGYLP